MVQEAIYQRRGTVKNFVFKYDGDIATADDVYLEVYELSNGHVDIWCCVDDYAQSTIEVTTGSTESVITSPTAGTPTGTLIHSSNPDTETPNWNSHQGEITATTFLGSLNGTINTATTGATQTAGDNSTKIATTAYVEAAVSGVGDITGVTAGTGMTGGGTSGAVTLNVIGGTGITANADDIAIDATVATLAGTQTFTNKSGSNDQWTNDAGYTANTGTTTADNTQTFTNKSGSNSQWTNDEGYTDLVVGAGAGDAKAGNTTTITSAQATAIVNNTAKVTDTGVPAILSDGTDPSLNSGISAAEVRTLIGAGTSSSSGVTSVTATAPVASSGGATPDISMAAASATVNGYLTSANWSTFNSKTSNTGTTTASNTQTFTNKSGSNDQWTNDAGYTANTGTTTADNTQTFTNKSGSNDQWTNDAGYTANTGTTTADNTQTFTNKSGSNSQWTNDEGYTDLVVGTAATNAMAGDTTTITSTQATAITDNTAKVTDTGVPAVLSDGSAPSLNTNISQGEMRTLIGAGTSSLVIGTTAA